MLRVSLVAFVLLAAAQAFAAEPAPGAVRILIPPAPRDPVLWPVEGDEEAVAAVDVESPARFQRIHRRTVPLCFRPRCQADSWHRQPAHLRVLTR